MVDKRKYIKYSWNNINNNNKNNNDDNNNNSNNNNNNNNNNKNNDKNKNNNTNNMLGQSAKFINLRHCLYGKLKIFFNIFITAFVHFYSTKEKVEVFCENSQ